MPDEKQDWLVYSELASDPPFRILLADCTREHVESVQRSIVFDAGMPSDIFYVPIVSVTNPERLENPTPYTAKENHVGG